MKSGGAWRRWLIAAGAVGLGALCGLLGLTAGINLNPAATVRFVPNWGSLADWFAGIFTLSAVVVSLWLARKSAKDQELREREDLRVIQVVGSAYVTLRVVSHGFYPVTVKKLFLTYGKKGVDIPTQLADEKISFPHRIEFREDAELVWSVDGLACWHRAINTLGVESLDQLRITVLTPIQSYDVPLDPSLIKLLRRNEGQA